MDDTETPEVEAMEEHPTIEGLLKLDDEGLCEVFGLNEMLDNIKENLEKISKLKGKPREYAEGRIRDLLTPSISKESLRWILEDAMRKDKQGAINTDSPASVL